MNLVTLIGTLMMVGVLIIGAVLIAGASKLDAQIKAEMDGAREDEVRGV